MAGFGGAVKLTGESEYRKALKNITLNLKELSAETKLVTAQYANNSKSIEALTAKQGALNKQYEAQAQKVKILKDQLTSLGNAQEQNRARHEQLKETLDKETAELERIAKESGTTSEEYKKQAATVASLTSEVNKSENALNQNEATLSKMRTQLTGATTDLTKTQNELDNVEQELEDSAHNSKNFGEAIDDAGNKASNASSGGFTVLKGILADLGASAIKAALTGLKNLGGALIDIGKQALDSYADYEQLVGGVETLFGAGGMSLEEYAASVGRTVEDVRGEYEALNEAQDIVMQNASQAYQTAGMSANDYMQNVTSFSAALVSSLGGDTVAAAEAANQALTDMADNSNKMGTDIESITQAYQGFARGQYQLLDNLKLGYGGTKTEMERLLSDAQALTGVEYDINNLSDVYEAIHVIQTEIGITGTTAKEASTTISGSVNSMKSAWSNLLTGVADDGANFGELVNDFIDSILTVADNITPHIQTIIEGIATTATTLISELLPELVNMIPPILQSTLPVLLGAVQSVISSVLSVLPQVIGTVSELIPQIVSSIVTLLPQIIDAGIKILVSLIQGISAALPQLIEMLPTVIEEIVTVLTDNLDFIIDAGIELLLALTDGIINALPQLIDKIPTIITKIVEAVINNLPKIIEAGIKILTSLQKGFVDAIPQLIRKIPELITQLTTALKNNLPQLKESGKSIINSLVEGVRSLLSSVKTAGSEIFDTIVGALEKLPEKMLEVGKNITKGLWSGLKSLKNWLRDKIKSLGASVINTIKDELGIHSPSLRFKDEVGKNIARGIGVGFEEEMRNVEAQMREDMPTLDVDGVYTGAEGTTTGGIDYNSLVKAFKEALGDMTVELDDRQVGQFVKKTVTTAIYT